MTFLNNGSQCFAEIIHLLYGGKPAGAYAQGPGRPGADCAVGMGSAVQSGADRNTIAFVQKKCQFGGIRSINGKREYTGSLQRVNWTVQAYTWQPCQPFPQILRQIMFMPACPLHTGFLDKSNGSAKAGNPRQVVGSGLKPLGKIVRLRILLTAAGATCQKRPEYNARCNSKKTGPLGP